jgi:hypothetical protein
MTFFPLRHRVQIGPGAPSVSSAVGTGDLTPEVKRPVREADKSPPSNVEVKNEWSYTSTPPYAFLSWCLI